MKKAKRKSGVAGKLSKKTADRKPVAIHPKHSKPFRKRHIGLLLIMFGAGVLLLISVVRYNESLNSGISRARDFVRETFGAKPTSASINSSYGFSIAYDSNEFYASAIDSSTGNLLLGEELSTSRAYQTVRISPSEVLKKGSFTSLTLEYESASSPLKASEQLANVETKTTLPKISTTDTVLTRGSSSTVSLGGVQFLKTDWKRASSTSIAGKFTVNLTTYTGIVKDRPFVITVNFGLSAGSELYEGVLQSLNFSNTTALQIIPQSPEAARRQQSSRSLLDKLLLTETAHAADASQTGSEYITSVYGPAVVKVYNFYCMNIYIDAKLYIPDVCEGVTGSGFLVSSDGYVATNGHVVSSSPKDIVIYDAVIMMIFGQPQYLEYLSGIAGVRESDFQASLEKDDALDIVVDKLYSIPDSRITASENVANVLVGLGESQPDTKKLQENTKNNQKYPEEDSVKQAEVVGSDYRLLDGIMKFYASDVALLKIDGSNYPLVRLGNISDTAQGGALNILGFPGNASDNGIVESSQSKVTLTTGKVSAIKNATGSEKKLIETDTTIGHGNSGGPAFSDGGSVIGIATYTADGSGQGDGVFNYIRDIQDFKDLVSSKGVALNTNSQTQTEWEKGIKLFNTSRYSKAIKSFEKVKQSYPQHPTVAQFISNAEEKIKNGEDVKDIPMALIAGGFVVILGGIGGALFLIIRHHGKHQLYKVAAGSTVPAPTGFSGVSSSIKVPGIPQPQQPIIDAAPQVVVPPVEQHVPALPIDNSASGNNPQQITVISPQRNSAGPTPADPNNPASS